MTSQTQPSETILIVDDEEPVRRTFREWLTGAGLPCRILSARDAEEALQLANQHPIDLAILDWALGAGDDGLHLLQDLCAFHPDVVAIMVTGFANQATPLDAMRMGVRDYLDKNHDLSRETFLRAVRRQLEHIGPARREKRLHQGLLAFREAVEKVLPLVQSTAALTDPLPLSAAVTSLFRFLLETTGARDGVLLVRHYDVHKQPVEIWRAYDAAGGALDVPLVPFPRSLAATVVSLQEPCILHQLEPGAGSFELQPFERQRQALLAAPLTVGPGWNVVLELFDKQDGTGRIVPFTVEDQRLLRAAATFGGELLRQALAHRQVHQVLFDAVAAALAAGEAMAQSLPGSTAQRLEQPAPETVLQQLRQGLSAVGSTLDADDSLRLAEAIRVLALRHGPAAVRHCIGLVDSLRGLLDAVTAT